MNGFSAFCLLISSLEEKVLEGGRYAGDDAVPGGVRGAGEGDVAPFQPQLGNAIHGGKGVGQRRSCLHRGRGRIIFHPIFIQGEIGVEVHGTAVVTEFGLDFDILGHGWIITPNWEKDEGERMKAAKPKRYR